MRNAIQSLLLFFTHDILRRQNTNTTALLLVARTRFESLFIPKEQTLYGLVVCLKQTTKVPSLGNYLSPSHKKQPLVDGHYQNNRIFLALYFPCL